MGHYFFIPTRLPCRHTGETCPPEEHRGLLGSIRSQVPRQAHFRRLDLACHLFRVSLESSNELNKKVPGNLGSPQYVPQCFLGFESSGFLLPGWFSTEIFCPTFTLFCKRIHQRQLNLSISINRSQFFWKCICHT